MSIVIAEQCNYCQQFKPPDELLLIGESVRICLNCRARHVPAIEAFDPPKVCVGCLRTWEQLVVDEAGSHVSFFAVWRDGEYTLLCRRCNEKYDQQNRNTLYRGTRYAWDQKL